MITEKFLKQLHKRAIATAECSPDEQTQVAALLIHPKSRAIIAEGFNGFIRGAPDALLPKTRPEKYVYMQHAEVNLICNAAQHGIMTAGCIVYCTLCPCIACMRMLYQADIKEVYTKSFYSDFSQNCKMQDLNIEVTNIGEFSKITINPRGYNG